MTAVTTFHFESELQRLLNEVGRRIVQWTCNHLESADRSSLPPELFWHNDHYRLKRLSPSRNWNSLFGKIRVWRWMYESTESIGLPALFPLELHLGVVAGVATPALADRVAQLTVEFSQRQVLSVLREEHHVSWGVTTLRKVTGAMAEAMSPFRHQAQVEQVLMWLQQQQFPDGRFFWLGPVSFAPGGADACRRAWLSRDLDRPGGSDRRSEAGALVS